MKTKRIIALTLSAAMAIGTASMLTACKPTDDGSDFVADNSIYHCAGQSNGPEGSLYEQGWNEKSAGATEKVTFVKDETQTNKNVFTLEMKLYAGDQFKIVHDESWAGELTTYYFVNAEEDSTYNYVAKTDGEVIFRDYSSSSSNITLTEGHDGIYKFTLETNPSATDAKEMYKISYELVEAIPRLQIPYDMKVLGDFNIFGRLPSGVMTNNNGVWSTIITITEEDFVDSYRDENGNVIEVTANALDGEQEVEPGDNTGDGETTEPGDGETTEPEDPEEPAEVVKYTALYIANLGDGEEEGDEMAYVDENCKTATITVGGESVLVNLLTEGKWAITFNQETKTVTITEMAYELYFIGSWYAEEGTDNYGWGYQEGYKAYPLTPNTDGTIWTGTLTLNSDAQVQIYNEKGATDSDKYIPGNNYNLTAGKYFFKYNTETGAVEYEKYNYYLVGTFVDDGGTSHNFEIVKDLTPIFEATENPNVFKVTYKVEDVTGISPYDSWLADSDGGNSVFAIQVVYGTSLNGVQTWNVAGGNQYFHETGTFEITLDITTAGTPVTWTPVTE
ncbi:MAG: hypothetical protein K2J83_07745 [Clostridia bacterium]|nr:hypothetical protein [Clostridia bacterium]